MTRRNLSVSLGLFASLAGSAGLPETTRAQEPPPTFPARVEQVTVDVVVADKAGSPITGLRQEDLEVYENGVRQTIVSFDAVEVAAAPAEKPARPPRVSTNTTKDDAARTHLRDRLRRRSPHGLHGPPGQGGGGGLPEDRHPRGRPGHPGGHRGRDPVERPHGGGPRRDDRAREAPGGTLRPGHEPRAPVRVRSHAHPRLPRRDDHESRPAALRDGRRPDHAGARPKPHRHPSGGGPRRDHPRGGGLFRGHRPQPGRPRGDRALAQRARRPARGASR